MTDSEPVSWLWFVGGALLLAVLIVVGMCLFMARQRDNIRQERDDGT
jgi:ABC-type phosphate transport system auxiliary subunit